MLKPGRFGLEGVVPIAFGSAQQPHAGGLIIHAEVVERHVPQIDLAASWIAFFHGRSRPGRCDDITIVPGKSAAPIAAR
jgi:hypothetical protein